MRLAHIADQDSVRVRREGDFQNLGFLADGYDQMLVFLDDERFAAAIAAKSNVAAVLTTEALGRCIAPHVAWAACESPRLVFAQLHNGLARTDFYWEDFSTEIDPGADVHPTAWVADRNVRIGCGSVVGPHATVQERCLIGGNVQIGPGVVLGGEGFQTVRAARPMLEMSHAGGLVIEDHARILAGAVIATGMFRSPTRIGSEARIGAQAFVSHAVDVGERAFVGHGAIVNGNVVIGAGAWVGPGATISNNLTLGPDACATIGSVVTRNVEAGERVSGNFAIRHARLLRLMAGAESGGQSK